jgi:hypothetical protein
VYLGAIAVLLLLGSGEAGATHEGASTPCCAANSGSACDEANTPEDFLTLNPKGCLEDGATNSCAGGSANPNEHGVAGCTCVAGICTVGDSSTMETPHPATAEECTARSVAVCCAAGACHPAP